MLYLVLLILLISFNTTDLLKQRSDHLIRSKSRISFEEYNTYEQIIKYLQYLKSKYPRRVSLITSNLSTEGRMIPAIKISSRPKNHCNPIIMIEAGIHAREWISPQAALYVINQLIETRLFPILTKGVDWIIMPIVNPDGYVYSFTKDRLWRKNRKKLNGSCYGVDINRNFNFHWQEEPQSNDECGEIFAGYEPFSEPESKFIRDLATKYKNRIKLYVALHSHGPLILYPWSYNETLPKNHLEHAYLAKKMSIAIENVRGTHFPYNASFRLMGLLGGVSDDWIKAVLKVPIVFTIELQKGGLTGFDPPASKIKYFVEEFFPATKEMYKYIAKKYGYK